MTGVQTCALPILWFPSDARFVIAWLAVARIGAVAVTISTLATGPELRKIAAHADLRLILARP